MSEKEKTEGQKIWDSLIKALVLTMGLIIAGLLFDLRGSFEGVISIMGFVLFFLLFYAVR